jgi:YfiH family protein
VSPVSLVTLKQCHSDSVIAVGPKSAARDTPANADGLVTRTPGALLAVQTADCIPVLVVDPRNRAVGAFHAGWRGTAQRIVEKGIGRMRMDFGSNPEELHAAIGPGIGPCCYAVGDEVRNAFDAQFAYAPELFHEVYDVDPVRQKYPMLFLTARAPGHSDIGPQLHLDLWEANRRQLIAAGLREENIWVSRECTSCKVDRYFSHRAEYGAAGRMLAVIGVRKS